MIAGRRFLHLLYGWLNDSGLTDHSGRLMGRQSGNQGVPVILPRPKGGWRGRGQVGYSGRMAEGMGLHRGKEGKRERLGLGLRFSSPQWTERSERHHPSQN